MKYPGDQFVLLYRLVLYDQLDSDALTARHDLQIPKPTMYSQSTWSDAPVAIDVQYRPLVEDKTLKRDCDNEKMTMEEKKSEWIKSSLECSLSPMIPTPRSAVSQAHECDGLFFQFDGKCLYKKKICINAPPYHEPNQNEI